MYRINEFQLTNKNYLTIVKFLEDNSDNVEYYEGRSRYRLKNRGIVFIYRDKKLIHNNLDKHVLEVLVKLIKEQDVKNNN